MAILKKVPALLVLLLAIVVGDFFAYLMKTTSEGDRDIALYRAICNELKAAPACAEQMRSRSITSFGLLLSAKRQLIETGPLDADYVASIKAEWRQRYLDETKWRIYPVLVNQCTEIAGDRCPQVFEISSWDHQELLQSMIDNWQEKPQAEIEVIYSI